MKFDRFLEGLFSIKTVAVLVLILLVMLGAASCDWSKEEQILCVACGCIMPDRCLFFCGDAGECALEGCSDGMDAVRPDKGTASCSACNCVKDVMTDENGDPIDCEDVGCPECQKYFECE